MHVERATAMRCPPSSLTMGAKTTTLRPRSCAATTGASAFETFAKSLVCAAPLPSFPSVMLKKTVVPWLFLMQTILLVLLTGCCVCV